MTAATRTASTSTAPTVAPRFDAERVARAGDAVSRAGLAGLRVTTAGVLGWIGAMKFTAYEAGAIEGLVASSPFLGWLYDVASLQAVSNAIGTVEIVTALALLAGFRSAAAALGGAVLAAATFAVTLSFLFTAPGWEASLGSFPALSVVPGQFLLKDAVLLAAGVLLAGEALGRLGRRG